MTDNGRTRATGSAKSLLLAFGATIVVIFVTEAVIMLLAVDRLVAQVWGRALLNATLLSAVAFPLLYFFVFRPLVRQIAERERTEHALRESEDRYRDLVEHSHDLICTHDLQGRVLSANAPALQITGFSLDQALRMNIADLLGPKERPLFRAYLDEIRAQGRASGVMRIHTASGDTRFWEYDNTLRTEGGAVPVVRGVARDVTERKQAERALRASEERLRALIQHGQDFISLVAVDGTLLWESPSATRPLGYPPGAHLRRNILELVHPDDVAEVLRLRDEVVKAPGSQAGGVFRLRKSDGSWCWIEGVATNLLHESSVKAIVINYRDITARRRSEHTHRLQSAALNAAANAIVITDRDGTIEWANPAFTALCGYTAEEAIGRNPRDLLKSGAHDAGFYAGLWQTLLAGHVWRGEMINRRKDGSRYPEEQVITPVKEEHGTVSHFIAIKRDLTEEKQAAMQVLQSQKMEIVGRLAGGIAHDFNNLLTVINGAADFALTDLPQSHPLRTDLEQILAAGTRAAALTRQLLAFSRKQIMKPVLLNLSTVIDGMRSMLPRLIGEDIALTMKPQTPIGAVLADPGQIEQVILNLVVNARDAMPEGGTLTIETRDVDAVAPGEGPRVMLAVSDTGAGMDDATRCRIFEPFFTTKDPGKGTGLGLSTVDGIVRQSGGSIVVDSAVGQGTTFMIYLPRVAEPATPRRPSAARSTVPGTETVLLVEDEQALGRLAARILRSAGYTVLIANSGEEALDVLAQAPSVDLLFTDVVLPGISGRELAARVADVRPEVRVLFTSGYTDDAILRLRMQAQATHFVGKPYTAAELTRQVRYALDAE